MLSVYYYAFGIWACKSWVQNVDEIDTKWQGLYYLRQMRGRREKMKY